MLRSAVITGASCFGLVAGTAGAQLPENQWEPTDTAISKFIALGRAGTARYREQRAAVDDGYRRVGMDFPGMGEHWVSLEYVITGVFDPARPAILSYTPVNGKPELVGAVYAVPIGAREQPPLFPASVPKAWHLHSGSIDDESLLLDHDLVEPAQHSHGANDDPTRLAVLHVWMWAENPAGLFATDNWSLPFRRLGLAAPASMTPAARDAARALSLSVGDGAEYFRRLTVAVTRPLTDQEIAAVTEVLAGGRRAADEWLARRRATGWQPELSAAELEAVADVWRGVTSSIARRLTGDARARFSKLQAVWR